MKKKSVALVVPQKDFRDEELIEVRKILEQRGFLSKVISKTRDKIHGILGTELEPDMAIRELDSKDFIGIVFIGGQGVVDFFEEEDFLKTAQAFKWSGKVTAAIDNAPSILANAGCLIGKVATSTHTEEQNLRNKGADYTGMPVEVDGMVVTCKNVSFIQEFGDKLSFILEEIN